MNSTAAYIYRFFSKGNQRSLAIKKNIIASFFVKGLSIGINLALVPLTIDYINPTKYGIWLTLSSIIGWFSFFDIGLGNGLRNRFAESKAKGDTEKARIYISTTYAVLIIIFVIIWIIFTSINFLVDWSIVLNTPVEMNQELSRLSFIVFSLLGLRIILKTISTIVIADQRPAIAGFFEMLGQLFSLLLIYILTKTSSGSLINLGVALGFAPVLTFSVFSVIFFKRGYKEYSPSYKYIDFCLTKDIIGLGFKFFLIQISAVVIFQTSNILITQIMGPNQVTIYNIAYKYFFIIGMLFIIILTPFWSAFTEAYINKDYHWMRANLKRLKKIWMMMCPIVGVMVLVANSAYKVWIGDIVVVPLSITLSMAIYILIFTRFNIFIYLINGIGKVKIQIITNIIICIFYIPIGIILCRKFGLVGIVYANIVVSLFHAVIGQIQIEKIISKKDYGIWGE